MRGLLGAKIEPKASSLAQHVPFWGMLSIAVAALLSPGIALGQTPTITSTSGSWADNASVTITGSGFGSKTTAAPHMWDDMDHGLSLAAKGWDNYTPTACSGIQNIGYRRPSDVGRGVGLPHSHVQRYVAGDACNGSSSSAGKTDLGIDRTINALPAYTYFNYYYRLDPNWVFTQTLPNHKEWVWSWGEAWVGSPANAYCYVSHPDAPTSATNYGSWGSNNDGCGWPGGSFGSGTTNPSATAYWGRTGPVSPYLNWIKIEIVIKHSKGSDAFIKVYDNGELVMTESGFSNVDPKISFPHAANETITAYDRVVGSEQWTYIADVYSDVTLQRALLCTGSTWATRGICEPQIPTAWSDGSMTVTVNQGKFADGSSAYLYVANANDTANSSGFHVSFGTSSGSAPPPPQNVRVEPTKP